jgi:predicted glycogen debranching enzyme
MRADEGAAVKIAFGRQVCGTLAEGATREWLAADGVGGYAMGTVSGLRTRRYHGLLVVPVDGPAARRLGLAALDPVAVIGDRRVRLAAHEWAGGAVDPAGHELLASFELDDGVPRWRWRVGDVVVEREVAMCHGRTAVAVQHRLVEAAGPVRLEVTPLCTWRDYHGERFGAGEPDVRAVADGFVFEGAYRVAGPSWRPGGQWYRRARLRAEADRGLPHTEDLWAAGSFAADLRPGQSLAVVAAAAPYDEVPAADEVVDAARARARECAWRARAHERTPALLAHAADQFVVATDTGPAAVAGYPWFGEWSRDLMTSYEGLFLATGRWDEGREALRRAAATVSAGMLANTADTGTLEYNTADATLWFVHAVGRHVAVSGDTDLGAELAPALHDIVKHHVAGTRFGIGVDPADGLLRQGADGWALTWMDARVDGRAVTPRAGKAVEVNALWLDALGVLGAVAPGGDRWRPLREQARESFTARFPRPDGAGLYDVVDGPGGVDAAVRPNQLLAVSLPHAPAVDRAVVETCRRALLCPLGLRSLAPGEPGYRPRHRGGPAERDAAYHQGTVWPWLIGPYADAARRTGAPVGAGLADGFALHLHEWGLGSVSETADGDPPHAGTGCPFQAWSVAELLRVWPQLASGSDAAGAAPTP